MSLTETNPGRSRRLLADAEALACDITDQWGMVHFLGRIAHALVAIDPDRSRTILIYAAPIARGISDPDLLRDIAETLADTEPNRAEETARSITDDPYSQVAALRRVAKALAHTDPDRSRQVLLFAAQVARSFANPDHRDIELSQIA